MKRAIFIVFGIIGVVFFVIASMAGNSSDRRVPLSCSMYGDSILIESDWRGETEKTVLGPDAIYQEGAFEPVPWRDVHHVRGYPVWPDRNSRTYYLEVHTWGRVPPFAVDRDCWTAIGRFVPAGVGLS